MNKPKKIAIVGGGTAGLAAGIWAQLSGFESVIFEKNAAPGGFLAGWQMGSQWVEACFQGLVGTREGTPLNRLWEQADVLGDVLVVQPESFLSAEEGGVTVTLWQDLERFEREAAELSPEDAEQLAIFCETVRTVQRYVIPVDKPSDLRGPLEQLRDRGGEPAKALLKAAEVGMRQFVGDFHHPAIKRLFSEIQPQNGSLALFLFQYAMFTAGDRGIPVGGPAAVAERMAARYRALGGTLRLNTPVERILVAHGVSRGVELHSGERFFSHWTVAACDPDVALHHLVKLHVELDKRLQVRYQTPEQNPVITGAMCIFRALEDPGLMLSNQNFPVEPFQAATRPVDRLNLVHFGYDPRFSRDGSFQFACMVPQGEADFAYWNELHENETLYHAECEKLLSVVGERLKQRFPGLALRPLCCAPPDFYARRTGAYHGAWAPFATLPDSKQPPIPFKMPEVQKLLLSGQWMHGEGGLHAALIEGKFSIQRICKEERIPFVEES